jgi:tRNA(Ile2) C34 agmatinyltransferase TiaS
MKVYIGFDDTDTIDADRGTGKLVRWFERALPEGCTMWGVVRQQLLVHPAIPYTSHNSSACAVVECIDSNFLPVLIENASRHIEQYALPGSDPGLCVASEDAGTLPPVINFGIACTHSVVTQKDAVRAALGLHLSGHGGTCDGIIGAAAAVGLTAYGWSGRLIGYKGLRDFPRTVTVKDLARSGILVISLDRDARVPAPDDVIDTSGWLRPRLLGGRPVLPVAQKGPHMWESLGRKRGKKTN